MNTALKLISNINNAANYKMDGSIIYRGATTFCDPEMHKWKNANYNNNTNMQMYKTTNINKNWIQKYLP